ncbi:tyrosine-type recombinase/integrase [Kitasatospora sp. NPDC051164]|uniref:tyrosine-type recombinase/integrase n=1 Tax=Kitasatospora sp. NPDC051164 TaxID=3364055 RepID=UPI003794A34B
MELASVDWDEPAEAVDGSRRDPLYAAFALAVALGLLRGVLGLHWSDIDLENRTLTVQRQLRHRDGELYEDTPKSRRQRVIPLPMMCVAPLRWQRLRQSEQRRQRLETGKDWPDSGSVFTTATGQPIEPRNLTRSFTRVAKAEALPPIRLHDTRHDCATPDTAARRSCPPPVWRPGS